MRQTFESIIDLFRWERWHPCRQHPTSLRALKSLPAFSIVLALSLLLIIFASQSIVMANPKNKPTQPSPQAPASVPNQLLVMVHAGADKTEVSDALKRANGTIVKTMSNGRLTCYVIEVPKGKLEESMKKLSKDKQHFDSVQTNVLSQTK